MKFFFRRPEFKTTLAALLIAILMGILYFFTAPHETNIRWPDSPRHAMNGVFIMDAFRELPLADPMGWAYAYYNQYPAITFGFYPPLSSFLLAPFYALLGVSTASNVAFMATFAALLFLGVYFFARRLMTNLPALTAAVLLFGTSEVLLWGRQMMLEVPMMAFIVGSLVFFLRYLETNHWLDLALSTGLMVAALYTKQTAGIFVIPMLSIYLWNKGLAGCRRKHIWLLGALAILALIPLFLLQIKFASFNIQSVMHRADVPIDRFSLQGLLWYPLRLVQMTNLPFTLLAGVGMITLITRFNRLTEKRTWLLIMACVLIGWLAMTLIALKETRHAMHLLPFLAIIATAPLAIFPHATRMHVITFGLSIILLGYGLMAVRVDTVEGPRQAADFVVDHMPEGGSVAISAHLDGPFIFQIRQHDPDRRYRVTRIDKLLLDIKIMSTLGLHPKDLNRAQIAELLDKHNFKYIVLEPNNFMEAATMQEFVKVLQEPPYKLVASIDSTTTRPRASLLIYQNNAFRSSEVGTFDFQKPSVLEPARGD